MTDQQALLQKMMNPAGQKELDSANDDFGWRFFGAGGATVGTVLEFRRAEDNARTAWVKFEYR